ncbi:MAG: DUF2974 domain-containing protein [Rothia sp. (in: high G+C Gram-positive bacteria)]|uniref:Mbeg1-like protein n=1 Tax=Rothia sp. (in: high G+C Gram-positive bacteria) TaxID=1885016 RepID=UPI00270F1360|nr:DUF2974 domain-containing protein [Rothia sp. (in: high G+C Gram-positive bacteria)]
MNLLTYAQRHLHDTPAERPLTHVDLCLLNELAYLPLDVVAEHHAGFAYGVGAGQIYQEFYSDSDLRANWFLATAQRLQLLKLVAASARFAGLRFYHYEAKQDDAEQVQFAALTLVLPGVLKQVIFRGTDDTLTGWKEDFHLAARQQIPAQALAVDYLSRALTRASTTPLFVTGHSKGGHLAVHAASMQSELAQGRIDQLITFDSPGFVPEFLDNPGYQRTLTKTVEYIPADSIVGRLMFRQGRPQVVASSFFGLVQHSVFNWHADTQGHFTLAEAPTLASDRVETVTRAWMERHSPEEVQQVVDICFSLAMDEGYTSLLAISQNIVPFIQLMRAKAQELDPGTYQLVQGTLDDFLALWRQTRSEQRKAGGGVLKKARPRALATVRVGSRDLASLLAAERGGRLP